MDKGKIHPHKVSHYPEYSGNYNFVQILLDLPGNREYPVLILPNHGKTHGEILEEYLKSRKIEHPIIKHSNKNGIIPSLIGKNYCVVGMGRVYFSKNKDTLKVKEVRKKNDYGSAGLEIKINKEHFFKIIEHSKIEEVIYEE